MLKYNSAENLLYNWEKQSVSVWIMLDSNSKPKNLHWNMRFFFLRIENSEWIINLKILRIGNKQTNFVSISLILLIIYSEIKFQVFFFPI